MKGQRLISSPRLTTRETGSANGWRAPRIDDARAILPRIRVESRVWVSEDGDERVSLESDAVFGRVSQFQRVELERRRF